MAPYDIYVASALDAIALFSATLLGISRWRSARREGKIKLPVSDGVQNGNNPGVQRYDPFDVTTPEDVLEGYPLEEESFWDGIKTRKRILTTFVALYLATEVLATTLSPTAAEQQIHGLRLGFAAYTLILSLLSLGYYEVELHRESTWHMTMVLLLQVLAMGFAAILPSDASTITVTLYSPSVTSFGWVASVPVVVTMYLSYLSPAAYFSWRSRCGGERDFEQGHREEQCLWLVRCLCAGKLFFSFAGKVLLLGASLEQLQIGDLPILSSQMRATYQYVNMRNILSSTSSSSWSLVRQLLSANKLSLPPMLGLSLWTGSLFYLPPIFLKQIIVYLETDGQRENVRWGLLWVFAFLLSNILLYIVTGQVWFLSIVTMQNEIKMQLSTALYAKTLVRKDIASASAAASSDVTKDEADSDDKAKDDAFSSKAQIMTLMTTDVDRIARLTQHLFFVFDVPIELAVGTIFLYQLLGTSAFWGLAVALFCLPLNHIAGKVVSHAQDSLMKARDERVALMNEVLGGIRMLKFMAWERSFEKRIMKIRARELHYQWLNYAIQALLSGLWALAPIVITLAAFYHFAIVRGEQLTPSIAFTSIIVFNEFKYVLAAIPETLIAILQTVVSIRRVRKYLGTKEVAKVSPLEEQPREIKLVNCTITWPAQASASAASTPRQQFLLMDLNLEFPGTLLLLGLLGEADVLAGSLVCPRSPPDALARYVEVDGEWLVEGLCGYVPQTAWLQNATIRDNILFNLPYDDARYKATLEACALTTDLQILEDGDQSEIGERGVNLSGGQKARVSLARAVYSRASILLLDDVLSAVDAHTAHHLYNSCLRGELMRGRTLLLVSHHVQLCAPGAAYVVALDNGTVKYAGDRDTFRSSGVMGSLVQSAAHEDDGVEDAADATKSDSESERTTFLEEERRATGRVAWSVWMSYIAAAGSWWYWLLFIVLFAVSAMTPVLENGWLGYWSSGKDQDIHGTEYFIGMYAAVCVFGLVVTVVRFFVLYFGGIHASQVLYKKLLSTVLFAQIRFHDTVARGALLNRFGRDIEVIDSTLPTNIGQTVSFFLAAIVTLGTLSVVGGPAFILPMCVVLWLSYQIAKIYGQTSRDLRRLDSVTRSPVYSMYSETIAGVSVLRAFGAGSKFLRQMLRAVDTNANPSFWSFGIRLTCLASTFTALIALVAVLTPGISAPLAGFAFSFSYMSTYTLLILVQSFVALEQAMVGLERVHEYSALLPEGEEFLEPRPEPDWPAEGAIECKDLVIRYAPELPAVLKEVSFEVKPGEKVGVLGRTGSGKSTLALSLFRFVNPSEGTIIVDGVDITKIGLTDLRSRLTIIPQDPTILSGTLRSTLDVFEEYEDKDIFEALRRVHLIPPADDGADSDSVTPDSESEVNANVFKNLDSPVSEGGDNFSTGEKQLLCMARAILKRSKVLVMDEATASVDYATDELIGKTIREEFAGSTILTIAHRLRTIIDYDRILLLDKGQVLEFDAPATLLANSDSSFYKLCQATGKNEFKVLLDMAGVKK
ncbi:unnamed protein product [Mycena citricolor]|uniref:Multidrug resistance-associated ABC transporter protein n=1 Tax=Mycena citricolor TaxID=2018698 RepID=A0AAD2H2W3_9AGAR|nr:unnamed protein product [Mycena citricolor]